MADVVFGFVYDFGPGEEWRATLGQGAFLNGVPLDRPPPERRTPDGRLELLAVESADPRWLALASDDLVAATRRIRAIGLDRRLAVPGRRRRASTRWPRWRAAARSMRPRRS